MSRPACHPPRASLWKHHPLHSCHCSSALPCTSCPCFSSTCYQAATTPQSASWAIPCTSLLSPPFRLALPPCTHNHTAATTHPPTHACIPLIACRQRQPRGGRAAPAAAGPLWHLSQCDHPDGHRVAHADGAGPHGLRHGEQDGVWGVVTKKVVLD